MNETRRVTILPSEYGPDSRVVEIAGQRDGWMKRVCDILYGTSEPGTYDVTVNRVEPTWPVIAYGVGRPYRYRCGRCLVGWDTPPERSWCPTCKAVLSGRVDEARLADFLRQEG